MHSEQMNRTTHRFSIIALCGLILMLMSGNVRADLTMYDIDISNPDDFGSGSILRVFGTITIDPDIVDSSAAITASSIMYQLDNEAPITLTEFTNLGGPQLDFIQIGNELFVKGLGQDNDAFIWQTSNSLISLSMGSGPNNEGVRLTDDRGNEPEWLRDNQSGNGFLFGTVSVPEPGTGMLLAGVSLIAMIRRRRS